MASIVLPKGFTYVIASAFSPVWVLIWQSTKVAQARSAAGIKYPQLHAEKAEAEAARNAHVFNCVQRAHQNTLESLPIAVIGTLVTGLRFPILAASLVGTWTLARVLYTRGYATGDPDERTYPGGALTAVVQFALALAGTWTVGEFVWAELQ
ncbi:membrane-associated proteins in eicosanoid and glutathione metabolism [Gloeophyllum trabeum ATCC 11539]|uniref:Membrane-associated proteins in eicosanoid and glutathione metabolism n=1 Tax=Gloeophyllum trabeum (strain ATCC 11539 / FP-39264 / Madison 617) TaxID=670483 RepID=S7RYD8_GLOTA|nr:membrane-associated proteins in eicosanoid and glutathione metabolism [Gloeophyllum trabeum ATCC 11539]EPQ59960.1 membrane-associated proteins in eicosanoid and glutathione metabolism [Gloeophyllum trabeum ATCC 11539]